MENTPQVEGTPSENPQVEETPEVVLPSDVEAFEMPEKFKDKSAEDIAKAYLELEKLKGQADGDPNPNSDDNPNPTPEEEEESNQQEKEKSEAVEDLINQYVERGTPLTDEDYADLEAKGYSRKQVDIYKAGVEAQRQAEAIATVEKAGTTMDELSQAAEWAKANWSEERITQFNETIEKAEESVQVQMIQLLTDSFKASGSTPQITEPLHANTKTTPKSTGYASMEEMIADMNDPRYDQRSFAYDPAYYKAVRDKAARSSL